MLSVSCTSGPCTRNERSHLPIALYYYYCYYADFSHFYMNYISSYAAAKSGGVVMLDKP